MFEGKTLIGVGCSHVFGTLGDDNDPVTCYERSWVKKLERLGNFKDSVNLGAPGGSNDRSERVLFEYLKNSNTRDLVVIISLTQLSRKELVYCYDDYVKYISLGSWMIDINAPDNLIAEDEFTSINRKKNVGQFNKREQHFFEVYYSTFHHRTNDVEEINRKVVMMHTLLESLNIEHYFFEMLAEPETIEPIQLGHTIPMIKFKNGLDYDVTANDYLDFVGFKPGKCMHWDHDGNEFLADYILKYIKEHYHG